ACRRIEREAEAGEAIVEQGFEFGARRCCDRLATTSRPRPRRGGAPCPGRGPQAASRRLPRFFRWTRRTEIAAGVTPETRLAWPIVSGRCRARIWRTSKDRHGTDA